MKTSPELRGSNKNSNHSNNNIDKHIIQLGPKIYRIAHCLLDDHDKAREVTSEVFAKLHESAHRHEIKTETEFESIVITKELCFNALEKANPDSHNNENTIPAANTRQKHNMNFLEKYRLINRIITGLKPMDKLIIHLLDVEGYTYEQVAGLLNIENIQEKHASARTKIKQSLYKTFNYESGQNL